MCSSQVCAKLAQKFWSLLNQPASHGPFQPKLWTSLATVFVDIFWKEKNWVGFRPFPMTHWKEFLISWKKRRFEIFWSSWKSILTLSTNTVRALLISAEGNKAWNEHLCWCCVIIRKWQISPFFFIFLIQMCFDSNFDHYSINDLGAPSCLNLFLQKSVTSVRCALSFCTTEHD